MARSKATDLRKASYLKALVDCRGNTTRAACQAGIDRSTAWVWERNDTDFATRFDDAMGQVLRELEDEAYDKSSVDVGLLKWVLARRNPDKWGDRQTIRHEASAAQAPTLLWEVVDVDPVRDCDAACQHSPECVERRPGGHVNPV